MFNFMKAKGQVKNDFRPIVTRIKDENQKSAIYRTVYSTDPKTGLPSNDLGMLQNPNTPEDVKRFIDSMLIGTENSPAVGENFKMTEGHADELLEAMPQRFETLNSYEARVKQLAKDAKDDNMRKKMEFYTKKVRQNFEKIAKGDI